MTIQQILKSTRIIPVITITELSQAIPLAEALITAGLSVLEITLRSPVAIEAIAMIVKKFPQAIIGAGTILQVDQFDQARASGAQFAVSPGFNDYLVQAAKTANIPYLPGVVTPSEVMRAREHDFTALKFFPAEINGGIRTLNSYRELFPDVRFCPTGGVTEKTATEYLALKNVFAVGGTWITPNVLVEKGDWPAIAKLAQQAAAL